MKPLSHRERLMHEYRLAELRLADKIERELRLPRPKVYIDDGFIHNPPVEQSTASATESQPRRD